MTGADAEELGLHSERLFCHGLRDHNFHPVRDGANVTNHSRQRRRGDAAGRVGSCGLLKSCSEVDSTRVLILFRGDENSGGVAREMVYG